MSKLWLLMSLALTPIIGCDRSESVAVEMETYYSVFDEAIADVIEEATGERVRIRRGLIRVRPSWVAGLAYGDSVRLCLRRDDERLIPTEVYPLKSSENGDSTLALVGWYTGMDKEETSGLIGFKFEVTESELGATARMWGSRRVILVHFTQQEGKLNYLRMEASGAIAGDPILKK